MTKCVPPSILWSAPIMAKGAVRAPHAKRKLLLQGIQRVAALGEKPLHFRLVQGGRPVHVICLQVHVDGHDHALDCIRVSEDRDLGIQVRCLLVVQRYRPASDAHYMQTTCTFDTYLSTLYAHSMHTSYRLQHTKFTLSDSMICTQSRLEKMFTPSQLNCM